MEKQKSPALGVIVGRFHVHVLHDGHLDLIEQVISKHYRVLIVLGLSPVKNTVKNPLDFEARKQMILERFPHVTVLYQKDIPSDEEWSKNLDSIISDMIVEQGAVLYGSRDSFIDHYNGKFPTEILESKTFTSGTEVRRMISNYPKASADFRAGVIWSAFNRFPTSFQTVDVAIYDRDHDRFLLGRKKTDEGRWRLVGGFVNPQDESLEHAAARELDEEVTGIRFGKMNYLGSYRINDWRYKNENDKILTALFMTDYQGGTPEPSDDIDEVRWWHVDGLNAHPDHIVENHRVLISRALEERNRIHTKNPPVAGPSRSAQSDMAAHCNQNDLH